MERVPIAEVRPELPSLEDKQFHAVVSIVWPYSSIKGHCALLLVEPDFRLRHKRGQVRVRFTGPSAEAVGEIGVGIGDEVIVSLHGARFIQEETEIQTPGKSIEWELLFGHKLNLRVLRDGNQIASLDINEPVQTSAPAPATNQTPVRPVSFGPTSSQQWSSPAFLKRARLSNGALDPIFNPLSDGDEDYDRHDRKRRRRSYKDWKVWRYSSRTPSPEKQNVPSVGSSVSTRENTPVPTKSNSPAPPVSLPTPPAHSVSPSNARESEGPAGHPIEPLEDVTVVSHDAVELEQHTTDGHDHSVEYHIDEEMATLAEASYDGYAAADEYPLGVAFGSDVPGDTEPNTEASDIEPTHQVSHTDSSGPSSDAEPTHDEERYEIPETLEPEEQDTKRQESEVEAVEVFQNEERHEIPETLELQDQYTQRQEPEVQVLEAPQPANPNAGEAQAVMPPPTLPLLHTNLDTSSTPSMLTPIGQEPRSPVIKPLDSSTLPLPSPFPGEHMYDFTSYLDNSGCGPTVDNGETSAGAREPSSEPRDVIDKGFYESVTASHASSFHPTHESAFTDVRFTFGFNSSTQQQPEPQNPEVEKKDETSSHPYFGIDGAIMSPQEARLQSPKPQDIDMELNKPELSVGTGDQISHTEDVYTHDSFVEEATHFHTTSKIEAPAEAEQVPPQLHRRPYDEKTDPAIDTAREITNDVIAISSDDVQELIAHESAFQAEDHESTDDKAGSETEEPAKHKPEDHEYPEAKAGFGSRRLVKHEAADQTENHEYSENKLGSESEEQASSTSEAGYESDEDSAEEDTESDDEMNYDYDAYNQEDRGETTEEDDDPAPTGQTSNDASSGHKYKSTTEIIDLGSGSSDDDTSEDEAGSESNREAHEELGGMEVEGIKGNGTVTESFEDANRHSESNVKIESLESDEETAPADSYLQHADEDHMSVADDFLVSKSTHREIPDTFDFTDTFDHPSIENDYTNDVHMSDGVIKDEYEGQDSLDLMGPPDQLLIKVPEGEKMGEMQIIAVPATGPARNTRSKTRASMTPFDDAASPSSRKSSLKPRSTLSPVKERWSPYSRRSTVKKEPSEVSVDNLLSPSISGYRRSGSPNYSPVKHSFFAESRRRLADFSAIAPSQELGGSQYKYANVAFVRDSEEDTLHSENSISTIQDSEDNLPVLVSSPRFPEISPGSVVSKQSLSSDGTHSDPTVVQEQPADVAPKASQMSKKYEISSLVDSDSEDGRSRDLDRGKVVYPDLGLVQKIDSSPPPEYYSTKLSISSRQQYTGSHLPFTPDQSQVKITESQISMSVAQQQSFPITPELTQVQTEEATYAEHEGSSQPEPRKSEPLKSERRSLQSSQVRQKSRPATAASQVKKADPSQPEAGLLPSEEGLVSPMSYYAPITSLTSYFGHSVNTYPASHWPDVFGVVVESSTEPKQSETAPHHYSTTLRITDRSTFPNATTVQIFRPNLSALPIAKKGDAILLRSFIVRSVHHKMVLLSGEASGWVVWRYSKPVWGIENMQKWDAVEARMEMNGPPVEISCVELAEARKYRGWWVEVVGKVFGEKEERGDVSVE